MPESILHMQLVHMIVDYVKVNILPVDFHPFLRYDLSGNRNYWPPTLYERCRPDVYADTGSVLIIGEAKSPDDVERVHSIKQYRSYIRECCEYRGESYLIIATRWDYVPTTNNLINNLCNRLCSKSIRYKIISELHT